MPSSQVRPDYNCTATWEILEVLLGVEGRLGTCPAKLPQKIQINTAHSSYRPDLYIEARISGKKLTAVPWKSETTRHTFAQLSSLSVRETFSNSLNGFQSTPGLSTEMLPKFHTTKYIGFNM